MVTAYIVTTAVAAAANAAAAIADFVRARFVLDNMSRIGMPHSWLFPLGALKAAGALGLLVGIPVPLIGVAAAAGLVLYFVGAILTVVRFNWYAHIPFPAVFLLLAAAVLTLRLVTV